MKNIKEHGGEARNIFVAYRYIKNHLLYHIAAYYMACIKSTYSYAHYFAS